MDHVLKTPHLPAPFTCFSRSSLFATTKFTIPTSQRKCFFDVGLILTTSWPTFFGSAFSEKHFQFFLLFKIPCTAVALAPLPWNTSCWNLFLARIYYYFARLPSKKKIPFCVAVYRCVVCVVLFLLVPPLFFIKFENIFPANGNFDGSSRVCVCVCVRDCVYLSHPAEGTRAAVDASPGAQQVKFLRRPLDEKCNLKRKNCQKETNKMASGHWCVCGTCLFPFFSMENNFQGIWCYFD